MNTPTPLTYEKIGTIAMQSHEGISPHDDTLRFARAIESEVNACWQKLLGEQEPVAWMWTVDGVLWDLSGEKDRYIPMRDSHIQTALYTHPAPDHTVLLQDVARVLEENWSSSAKMLAGQTLTLSDDAAECVRKQVDIYNRIKEALK